MTSLRTSFRLIRRLHRPGPLPRLTAITLIILGVTVPIAGAVFVAIGLIVYEDSGRLFLESRPGTLLPVALLDAAALVCLKLAKIHAPLRIARTWVILALLFALAAADDLFKFHEKLDIFILETLGIPIDHDTFDHLDDLIVALYALPAAAVVATTARNYFLRLRWTVILLAAASLFFAAMVALDMFTRLIAVEELAKIFAAALIFAGVAAAEHDPLTARLARRAARAKR